MAEEEEGFTFVDKRRVQADDVGAGRDAAQEPAFAAAGDADGDDAVADGVEADDLEADDLQADDADFGGPNDGPDVYGVIGYCISLLATEAWQNLGLLADPKSGEAIADLAQAKVAIDAVGDLAARLESAPSDAVPESLRRDLRTLVNDLRLNYVSRRGDGAASRN